MFSQINRTLTVLVMMLMLSCVPGFAQVDLSGMWAPVQHEDQEVDRLGGPPPGDYTGYPINDANRMRADTYDNSNVALAEWQCRPHPTGYQQLGPDIQQIERIIDPASRDVVAWRLICTICDTDRWIWMDGRPRPPEEALHTWEGFSAGKWEGNTLVVSVTHLKESYVRRNGLQVGPLATVTEFITLHGDYMDWTMLLEDPAYLTEPLIRNQVFLKAPLLAPRAWPCTAAIEEDRPRGAVPHYLPGRNPYLTEYSTMRGIQFESSRGGAETMYPEYELKLENMAKTAPAASIVNGNYQPRYDYSSSGMPRPDARPAPGVEPHFVPIRGRLYLLAGAGANITISIGESGVMLVDAGSAGMTDKVLAVIQQLAKQMNPAGALPPIRFVVNTHSDADHTGGSAQLTASPMWRPINGSMKTIAHQSVLDRLLNTPWQPMDTYFKGSVKLQPYFNGEGIEIIHVPSAHTDGDSIVWFRGSDVISTGDLYGDHYPVIDIENGGSIQGLIDGLNDLRDRVFPENVSERGTLLIPGHGRIGDYSDLGYYQNMVTIIRDRIQDMIKRGMTLEAVKAARPTFDYDPVYGRNPGAPDRFVEEVYRSLTKKQ